ncbi:hypothetical protein ABZ612_26045 [Streptomyces avermitilis]|uniref:hypothetical protein n=1 Tax=Streptomyces avermitilis TaxID=33903 RepID=UPI003411B310
MAMADTGRAGRRGTITPGSAAEVISANCAHSGRGRRVSSVDAQEIRLGGGRFGPGRVEQEYGVVVVVAVVVVVEGAGFGVERDQAKAEPAEADALSSMDW